MSSEPEAVADLLRSQGQMAFMEPTTETAIDAFEAEHDLRLPAQLKQWLLVSDGGDFFLPAGFQLRGVAHQPQIDVDDPDRPDDNYVVIGALSTGDPVLWERSSDRISIYNREAGRIEADESFADFFTFLKDLAAVVGIVDDDVE